MPDPSKLPFYCDYTTGPKAPFYKKDLFPKNPQEAAIAAASAVIIAAIVAITGLSLSQCDSSKSDPDTSSQAASSNKK